MRGNTFLLLTSVTFLRMIKGVQALGRNLEELRSRIQRAPVLTPSLTDLWIPPLAGRLQIDFNKLKNTIIISSSDHLINLEMVPNG